MEKDWADISAYLDDRGRDPALVDRVALQHVHVVPSDDREAVERKQHKVFADFLTEKRGVAWADEYFLTGTVDDILDRLREYEAAGTDQVILHPAAHEPRELDRQLDLWKDHLLPAFS